MQQNTDPGNQGQDQEENRTQENQEFERQSQKQNTKLRDNDKTTILNSKVSKALG